MLSCLLLEDVQKVSFHTPITLGKQRYFPNSLWDKKKILWTSRKVLLLCPERKTAWLVHHVFLVLLAPVSWFSATGWVPCCRVTGVLLLWASTCCAQLPVHGAPDDGVGERLWGGTEGSCWRHHLPLSTTAGYQWPGTSDTSPTTELDTVLSNTSQNDILNWKRKCFTKIRKQDNSTITSLSS